MFWQAASWVAFQNALSVVAEEPEFADSTEQPAVRHTVGIHG
mgnify:CR=1 FL=1